MMVKIKRMIMNMNTTQKIFVMIGVGSFVIFYISMEELNYHWNFHDNKTYTQFWMEDPFKYWVKDTNRLGIVSLFNMVVSSISFILFKDWEE